MQLLFTTTLFSLRAHEHLWVMSSQCCEEIYQSSFFMLRNLKHRADPSTARTTRPIDSLWVPL